MSIHQLIKQDYLDDYVSLTKAVREILHDVTLECDAPKPWGMYFQDTASPQMEALVELHDNIMFYLVIILFGVGWILVSIIRNYVNNKISNKYLNHGTLIELIWTISPALILILIAFPSFKLLYLMDEVTDPSLTMVAEGHQWYWSYQYPDFHDDDNEELEFDSYLVPESDLEEGSLDGCWMFEDASGRKKVSCWRMEEDGCWDAWRCLWRDRLKARTQEELKELKNSKNYLSQISLEFFFSWIKVILQEGEGWGIYRVPKALIIKVGIQVTTKAQLLLGPYSNSM